MVRERHPNAVSEGVGRERGVNGEQHSPGPFKPERVTMCAPELLDEIRLAVHVQRTHIRFALFPVNANGRSHFAPAGQVAGLAPSQGLFKGSDFRRLRGGGEDERTQFQKFLAGFVRDPGKRPGDVITREPRNVVDRTFTLHNNTIARLDPSRPDSISLRPGAPAVDRIGRRCKYLIEILINNRSR